MTKSKTYALIHKRNGEYYWRLCSDTCITTTQVPFQQKWIEKEDGYDRIEGIVSSKEEVSKLLTWLKIKPVFAKSIVKNLRELMLKEDSNE